MILRVLSILVTLVIAFLHVGKAEANGVVGYCGTPYDTAVTARYPIKGTWMYPRSACHWQNELENFHGIGGTTILQFGPSLKAHADPSTIADGCQAPGGVNCVQKATQDIGQNKIRKWLTYSSGEHYSEAISCPSGLDAKYETTVNGVQKVFWRIVLPHDGQVPCDYSWGGFDVLFVEYDKNTIESVTAMLTVADHLSMEAYLGAPALPVVTGQEWMIDGSMLPSHRDWARRVYADWQARHSSHPSFRGMYQSYELPLGSTYATPYEEYARDAAAFHSKIPNGKYVISPYLSLFKDGTSNTRTVINTVDGFKALAESGVDVIAPQDGRGTGKGAYYWNFQETSNVGLVDSMLGNYPQIDANLSFGSQFTVSAHDAFNGMKAMQKQLNDAGNDIELWGNVEAFEEDIENPNFAECGRDSMLSQTTKSRLDRALTFLAGRVDRVISFMYDPLFTCTTRGDSLLHAIQSDHERPIVANAFFWDRPSSGIVIEGHNIANSDVIFDLTWYDAAWQVQGQSVAAGWINGSASPSGLDVAWVPFDHSNMASSFYLHIGASRNINGASKAVIERYSYKY